MSELADRQAYKREIYAPYFTCSYAVHAFNLMNQKREIYYAGKQLPNMRCHLLFVAPPGFMKTYYLQTMAADPHGIFHGTEIQIASEQSMTEAGFVGTVVSVNGLGINNPGAAELNKDGLLLIDEFKAISDALKNQMNSQMETQLLAALDHGRVFKRLSSGAIAYQTNLSMWAGIQPGSYDLSSGLGRRLIFMVFLPTYADNIALMDIMHRTQNVRPNPQAMSVLWSNIDDQVHQMDTINKIEFDDSILKLYHEMDIYSFESSYFNRLILGYHLMKREIEPVMHLDVTDPDLVTLLQNEKMWRDDIANNLDFVQIRRIVTLHGGTCARRDIVKECSMVGWNAKQVYEKLADMIKYRLIETLAGDLVKLK
jgi:hypothetical protein